VKKGYPETGDPFSFFRSAANTIFLR